MQLSKGRMQGWGEQAIALLIRISHGSIREWVGNGKRSCMIINIYVIEYVIKFTQLSSRKGLTISYAETNSMEPDMNLNGDAVLRVS